MITAESELQVFGFRVEECRYLQLALAVSREMHIPLAEAKTLTYVEAFQALGAVIYG